MYSAVQVDGKRLYELARKGIEVDREPRAITVHSLEFEEFTDSTATMVVSCSKGTYIRTLIHDMGVELGTGAIMTSLVRTRSGNFTVRDCYRLNEVREASEKGGKDAVEKLLMPIDIIFNALPAARLTEQQTRMFLNGVVLDINRVNLDRPEGPFRVLSAGGRVIGIADRGAESDLAVMQRFFGAPEKKPEKNIDLTDSGSENNGRLKDVSDLKGVKL